jgi:CubicO group peptidase (beta-lactamase class C family)
MNTWLGELREDAQKDLKGVIVLIQGRVSAEAYFNGDDPETLHDIRSTGKSITSLLAGIAIDRRLIRSAKEPLAKLLPSPSAPDKAGVTLEDVLTMRSGLAADDQDELSPGNEDRMDRSSDWLDFALRLPMRAKPGETYVYASVNAFLVGAAIEKAAGVGLQEFAVRHLFGSLGISRFRWRRGPKGEGAGQGNLMMRLRDMAKIGELVLNGGVFAKKAIVSGRWLTSSLAPLVSIASVDPYADFYGYMWYTKTYSLGGRSVTVRFASGSGGNKIYIVPDYQMVLAITSSAYGRGYGQRRSEQILLRTLGSVSVKPG